jgi:hypothetical protein
MKRPSKEEVEREILALDTLDTKALQARWRGLYRKDPPPKFRARLLRLGIAYRLQELVFGGLQPRTVRLLRKLATELRAQRAQKREAASLGAPSTDRAPAARPVLSAGSQLMREWNGSTEIVDVTDDGFRWHGNDYRTLSAVAVAITGTKWSGPKFFGLVAPTPSGFAKSPGRAVRPEPTEAVATHGGST